jgi:hypothetical protein
MGRSDGGDLGWRMTSDEEALCRRIALYREYLRRGVDGDMACVYLDEIGRAERAVAELRNRKQDSSPHRKRN